MSIFSNAVPVGASLVPGGSAVGAGITAVFSAFGAGGDRDRAREERAQFFTQAAQRGSVLAARYILGGKKDVASNEQKYYDAAIAATPPDILAKAQAAGSLWNGADVATAPLDSQQMVRDVRADLLSLQAAPPPAAQQSGTVVLPKPPVNKSEATPATEKKSNVLLYVALAAVAVAVGYWLYKKSR